MKLTEAEKLAKKAEKKETAKRAIENTPTTKPDGVKKKKGPVMLAPPEFLKTLAVDFESIALALRKQEFTQRQFDAILSLQKKVLSIITKAWGAALRRNARSAAALEKKEARLKKWADEVAKLKNATRCKIGVV